MCICRSQTSELEWILCSSPASDFEYPAEPRLALPRRSLCGRRKERRRLQLGTRHLHELAGALCEYGKYTNLQDHNTNMRSLHELTGSLHFCPRHLHVPMCIKDTCMCSEGWPEDTRHGQSCGITSPVENTCTSLQDHHGYTRHNV